MKYKKIQYTTKNNERKKNVFKIINKKYFLFMSMILIASFIAHCAFSSYYINSKAATSTSPKINITVNPTTCLVNTTISIKVTGSGNDHVYVKVDGAAKANIGGNGDGKGNSYSATYTVKKTGTYKFTATGRSVSGTTGGKTCSDSTTVSVASITSVINLSVKAFNSRGEQVGPTYTSSGSVYKANEPSKNVVKFVAYAKLMPSEKNIGNFIKIGNVIKRNQTIDNDSIGNSYLVSVLYNADGLKIEKSLTINVSRADYNQSSIMYRQKYVNIYKIDNTAISKASIETISGGDSFSESGLEKVFELIKKHGDKNKSNHVLFGDGAVEVYSPSDNTIFGTYDVVDDKTALLSYGWADSTKVAFSTLRNKRFNYNGLVWGTLNVYYKSTINNNSISGYPAEKSGFWFKTDSVYTVTKTAPSVDKYTFNKSIVSDAFNTSLSSSLKTRKISFSNGSRKSTITFMYRPNTVPTNTSTPKPTPTPSNSENPYLYDFKITNITDLKWEDVFNNKNGTSKGVYFAVKKLPIDKHPVKKILPKKGYYFYFDLKSKYLNDDADTVILKPKFYYISSFTRSNIQKAYEVNLYYELGKKRFIRVGDSTNDTFIIKYKKSDTYIKIGGFSKLTLNKNVKTKINTQTSNWFGRYFLPATAKAIKKGTSLLKNGKINYDVIKTKGCIMINFSISAYKNGVKVFDYSPKQWKSEGGPKDTSLFYPGDTIIFDITHSSIDDRSVGTDR